MSALPVNVSKVGERTTLSLRPERVVISPNDSDVDNVCTARVEELIYLGDHIRTRAVVSGNKEFIIKVPNIHNHVPLKEGEEVKIGWMAEDCRALDA